MDSIFYNKDSHLIVHWKKNCPLPPPPPPLHPLYKKNKPTRCSSHNLHSSHTKSCPNTHVPIGLIQYFTHYVKFAYKSGITVSCVLPTGTHRARLEYMGLSSTITHNSQSRCHALWIEPYKPLLPLLYHMGEERRQLFGRCLHLHFLV